MRFLEILGIVASRLNIIASSKSKAHLIWALAHLGAGVAFANVIMYSQEEVVGLNEPEQKQKQTDEAHQLLNT